MHRCRRVGLQDYRLLMRMLTVMAFARAWSVGLRFGVTGLAAPRQNKLGVLTSRRLVTGAKQNWCAIESRFVTSLRKDCGVVGGDIVIASVSGGCDSVALLHLLALARSSFVPPLAVSVVHFEHGQRGEVSICDAFFVAALARCYGFKCTAYSWDSSHTRSSQINFRTWRRKASLALARGVLSSFSPQRCGYVAFAHHVDDQTESFLLRFARGSRLGNVFKGLVAQATPCFVRPLLFATKCDLVAYLDAGNKRWREDTTNADSSHYLRNFGRIEVLPSLSMLCGGSHHLQNRLSMLHRQAQFFEDWVTHATDQWLGSSTWIDGAISLSAYAGAPAPVRHEVLSCVQEAMIVCG